MARIKESLTVVGVGFRLKHDARAALAAIVKKRPIDLDLIREPENEYDPNAIAVWVADNRVAIDGHHLGYLPREVSEVLAPKLDEEEVVWVSAKLTELYARPGDTRNDYSTGNVDVVLEKS